MVFAAISSDYPATTRILIRHIWRLPDPVLRVVCSLKLPTTGLLARITSDLLVIFPEHRNLWISLYESQCPARESRFVLRDLLVQLPGRETLKLDNSEQCSLSY